MNDERVMAGGKVSRPCGGNEPPLTDKGTELRQAEIRNYVEERTIRKSAFRIKAHLAPQLKTKSLYTRSSLRCYLKKCKNI